jgi:hypothetical protein
VAAVPTAALPDTGSGDQALIAPSTGTAQPEAAGQPAGGSSAQRPAPAAAADATGIDPFVLVAILAILSIPLLIVMALLATVLTRR